MREAVICSPIRTPVGRFGGGLKDLDAETLGGFIVSKLVERTKLDPNVIDESIFGNCYPSGESPALGRTAALRGGLPVEVAGFQVDRRCGSGLLAVCLGAMEVQTGAADVVLAGGAESMSSAEFYTPGSVLRWGNRGPVTLYDRLDRARATAGSTLYPVEGVMIETAENVRAQYKIPREEQDEFSWRSHMRATAAWEQGKFDAEVVPVPVPGPRGGEGTLFAKDEHFRPDTTMERLASLRPVRQRQDPESTVTAGNASGENDGAAACIVTTPERARELGLKPMARFIAWAMAGVHPAYMGLGPVPATKKLFDRQEKLTLQDMDLIELNEAFAVQVLACTREWGFKEKDFDRLNVNGSGISLGHPVGATGVRILATLLHEMERRNVQFGMESMCIGGGQGISAIFERVN